MGFNPIKALNNVAGGGAAIVSGGLYNPRTGSFGTGDVGTGVIKNGFQYQGEGFTGSPGTPAPTNPYNFNTAADAGSAVGIDRGNTLYGQTQNQTGERIQNAGGKYEDRLNGTDAVTEALKQQKQASQANTARNFAGRGVAGGVAAAGMEQAGRQKDIDIAASAYQQNAQNLKDYTNLNSNIAANQGMLEQIYRGNAVSGVQLQPVQQQSGLLSQLFS